MSNGHMGQRANQEFNNQPTTTTRSHRSTIRDTTDQAILQYQGERATRQLQKK